MSHELLLVAGAPGLHADRLDRVAHAARRVPGAVRHELVETPLAAVALVHTEPAGGSSAVLERDGERVLAALAVTEDGLRAAVDTDRPHELGAEAGHVLARIGPDGLTVATDGLAFVPAYWGRTDDGLVLSTHLASLVSLGLPADIDEQAVAEYLVHMHPWGHRTLLERARLLAPGGLVRWRAGEPVRVEARPLYAPSAEAMTDAEAVAEFAALWPELLDRVRGRGGASRTVLALSGGLDSRAIAVGAAGIGWRPAAYTYGSSRNEETRTATRVAERLRLPHTVVPVTDDRLLRGAPRILDALDGAHSPGEMYESWFDDTLRSFADVVVNGMIAGPMWGDDKTMGMSDPDTVARQLRDRFAGALRAATPYVRTGGGPGLAGIVSTGIDAALRGWDFGERADMVMFWKQANKMLRWGSMLTNSLRRAGIRLEAPFLDRRFAAYSARLTPAQRLNGTLYLRVHREVLSAAADIERSDDGNPPRALDHVYWSGDRSIAAQMVALTARHPVAGVRRGGRRVLDVGAARLRGYPPLDRAADRLDGRRAVFPADVFLRRRPAYAGRLADLLESGLGSGSLLDDDAIAAAAAAVRAGSSPTPALALARIGAAGAWLNDYRRRAGEWRAHARAAG
ncbi:hypothetical protein GCG21_00490 [Pseudactinotalea sp. HY160]|uniref:asparagine synthase-related protein n=1 Tax=Pseudactinotalea sp. HY160 TaxID=2654490 RepID=UPI00128C6012|nr:asparagine synthase-related protein [Pseudactinotalea sp. HY160]MPV48511.1 hypothetical protein [Pseudactinotalea sp. HY160]